MKHLIIIFLLLISSLKGTVLYSNTIQSNQDVQIEIEVDQPDNKSEKEKIIGYLIDLIGPLVALFGIIIGIPILKKKLIENHISLSLTKIQEANSESQTYNQKLIDKYMPLTFSNDRLLKPDIQNVYNDIVSANQIAQKGSSDVATLINYLKITLESTVKHYEPKKSNLFSTRGFLGYIIEVLEQVNFYSTQVVQIPKSTKTKKHELIRKSIRRYVRFSHVRQYRNFKMGVINDSNSAHFTIFCGITNKVNHPLLMRSAFQIYFSPNAIAKLIFVNNIYAPSVLEMPEKSALFGSEKRYLFLVGFSIKNQLGPDPKAPSEVVDLVYSNPGDFYRFIDALTYEDFKSNYKDSWIEGSSFNLNDSISMTKSEIETFVLRYDRKYLEKSFKENTRKIRKKLKITHNRRFN